MDNKNNIYEDNEIRLISKELIELDEKINVYKNEIKKLNEEKKNKEDRFLLKFNEYKEKIYAFNNYVFKKNTNIINGQLKPLYIQEVLLTHITSDSDVLKQLLKNIMDKRTKSEKTTIKILKH